MCQSIDAGSNNMGAEVSVDKTRLLTVQYISLEDIFTLSAVSMGIVIASYINN